MAAFKPLSERARWQVVYDELVKTDTGDIVTYESLAEVLGLDPDEDRHAIQMAVRRAAKEHEEVDKRALDAVPNVGYRVVQPPEHLVLARRQQRRSTRALARGYSKAVNVDLTNLEPETRHALEMVGRAFAVQMEFNRRTDVRQSRLEQALASVSQRVERTEEENAALRARLERLESGD